MVLICILGFLTFLIQPLLCHGLDASGPPLSDFSLNQSDHTTIPYREDVIIAGSFYNFQKTKDVLFAKSNGYINLTHDWIGADITSLFAFRYSDDPCATYISNRPRPCSVQNKFLNSPPLQPEPGASCPDETWLQEFGPSKGNAVYSWDDISSNSNIPHTLVVFNGFVLNMTSFLFQDKPNNLSIYNPDSNFELINSVRKSLLDSRFNILHLENILGQDGTRNIANSYATLSLFNCLLTTSAFVGRINGESVGCLASQAIQFTSMSIVIIFIGTRIILATMFMRCYGQRISRVKGWKNGWWGYIFGYRDYLNHQCIKSTPQVAVSYNYTPRSDNDDDRNSQFLNIGHNYRRPLFQSDPYTILLVTCYSESEEGIRSTLESLASTDYPDSRKLLIVICDGLVTGSGSQISTPDAVISMVTPFNDKDFDPQPKSYLSIEEGSKQLNMAKVVSTWYSVNCLSLIILGFF